MSSLNKIIGFLITKKTDVPDYDIFNVGLNQLLLKCGDFNVFLWGVGDLSQCVMDDKYTLSFPINADLMDRNILIDITGESITVENDWLGSIPIFYNEKNLIVSTVSTLCLKDKEVDVDGLADYCTFGYSVFEKTPFKGVKFLRFLSRLKISKNEISVDYKIDPVLDKDFTSQSVDEKNVIEIMGNYVSTILEKTSGDIVLPTSGGYDSRLLNFLVKDKARIHSFTYGISDDQGQSFEVVHAKKISEIYHTKWQQITLDNFNEYISDWFRLYGFSVHLHGMYHIEFYKKIIKTNKLNNPIFLSGIIGDAWAESGKFKSVNNQDEVHLMGYSHGMSLDKKYLSFKIHDSGVTEFFNRYRQSIKNENIRAVYSMRIKLMLLSYLVQTPEYFGMPVFTPYLNFKVVKSTLSIAKGRRKKRIWQRDLFRDIGLDLEGMNLKSKKTNKLDYKVGLNSKFEPIDVVLVSAYFSVDRMEEINQLLKIGPNLFERIINEVLSIPKFGGVLRRLGFVNKYLRAQYDYKVIKAFEMGLKLGH